MLATRSSTTQSSPKQQRTSMKSWLKGYMSSLTDGRKPEDGLDTANEVILSQNGTIKPAPSSVLYGTQPTGTVLGQIFPFSREVSGSTEYWEGCLMNVSGTVNFYARKDGAAWTSYGSKTFPTDAVGRFDQIKQVVLIASKTDSLCWLDCSTMTIVTQTALSTPSAPTVAQTGMAGTNFTYRYRISAVNVGESQASTATTVQTSVQRDIWNPTSQWVDVTGSRVTGAAGYNVYMGLNAGEEVFLGYVADPGSGLTFTYRDDGTVATDASRVAPDFDSSTLPKLAYVRVLNDRIFGWGDKDDKWKVWYGGTGGNILKLNAFYGGGWTRVANGTRYYPNNVSMFRTGKGDPAVTVLCKAFGGMGKRFIMSETTTTEGDTTITAFGVQEDNGAYGTDAPDGVVLAEDDIFYPSKDSFKKTGNRVNLPNLLSSRGISDVIQVDVEALNPQAMDKCVGLYYQGRIYWAVPYGSSTSNNQIWTLDVTRGGAWMRPINVSADWMWLYQDNSTGQTHFCFLSGNQIYEFTYSTATTRNGVGFNTSIGSGIVKFSEDGQEWADVEKVVYVLIRPQGNIQGSVVGKTEDAPLATVGAESFIPTTSITGWGEFAWGEAYWGQTVNAPTEFGNQREELVVEVDEELQWLKYNLESIGAGADYELSDVIIYWTPIGVKEL